MNSFTPNMLKTFETCPKKYYFKYIEKISVPQKSNLFEKGKKVHALANYYLRGDDISKMEKALNSEELKLWEILKQNEFFNKTYVKNYYILDYKTGSIPKNPEYDYQTITYLLCASKMYGDNIKFIYIDLKNNQNSIIDFNSAKAKEYERRITDICDKITNTQFPEEIEHSKICNFCEYKKICL